MKVRVLAFARLRELLGAARVLQLPPDASVASAWHALAQSDPAINELGAATRIALNGRIAGANDSLKDGDELTLLPPVSGG